MSKRFTATEKWGKAWFRALTPTQKCAWQYLCDNCDSAGIFELDEGLVTFQIGDTLDWNKFIEAVDGRIARLQCGKLWVTGFISFQYGALSEDCKPHLSTLRILDKYANSEPLIKEFLKGSQTLKDKDKEKEPEKDSSSRKGNPKGKPRRPKIDPAEVPIPEGWDIPQVRQAIADWLDYKSKRGEGYKDAAYLGRKVTEFKSAGPVAFVAAVDSSIGNGYAGLFPSKSFNGHKIDNSTRGKSSGNRSI